MRGNSHLEEAADVDLVVRVHEDHVFKEPEEGPQVFLAGLQQLQDAVELKKQPAGALCRTKGQPSCVQFERDKKRLCSGRPAFFTYRRGLS